LRPAYSRLLFFLMAAPAAAFLFAPRAGAEEEAADFSTALDDAVAAARAGDREKAGAILSQLAEEHPGEPAAFYNLALAYEFDKDGNRYRGENLNAAASYYQQALAVDPGFTPARFNLAVVWQKLGYPDEAAKEYRLVVKGGGEPARRAEYNLALVLKDQGRTAEAERLLTEGEAPYEDVKRVRLLALLAEDAGEIGRAIRLWRRALEQDDDPTLSALATQHLQALRGY
jgi:tetratricopeptide (TPR) repeat protein